MSFEQFANGAAVTALNGAIDNVVTTLTVDSSADFPATGNFRIKIETELLLVTAVSGTTWTVTRGVEGTTAVAHADNTVVDYLLTAEAVQNFRKDSVQYDQLSNLPTTSLKEGMLFLPANSVFVQRYNGTSWEYFGPIWSLSPPKSTDFTWVNQSTTSVDDSKGVLRLSPPVNSTLQVRLLVQSAPATPYKVVACMHFQEDFGEYWGAGICVRQSSTSEIITFGGIYRTTGGLRGDVIKWDAPSTFNASYTPLVGNLIRIGELPSNRIWWQIYDDGTNRHYQWSLDGYNFYTYLTTTRTDFCTPDQVGLYILTGHATLAPAITYSHFKVY